MSTNSRKVDRVTLIEQEQLTGVERAISGVLQLIAGLCVLLCVAGITNGNDDTITMFPVLLEIFAVSFVSHCLIHVRGILRYQTRAILALRDELMRRR